MSISLSKEELFRFANIFDNAGQVFLAGLVIAPFFTAIDFNKTFVIALGLVCSFGCWSVSWWLTKEADKL